jgi:hypothetical protein
MGDDVTLSLEGFLEGEDGNRSHPAREKWGEANALPNVLIRALSDQERNIEIRVRRFFLMK